MSETEKVINDLNTAKLVLCNPQLLTTKMRVRMGQAITSAIALLEKQEAIIEQYHKALRGLRAKIKPVDDWEVSEELKEMISEVCLKHETLAPLKEQKHGHWIPIKTPTGVEYGGFEEYTAQEVVCSECGFTDDVSASIYTYCPNCGAKMDEEVIQDE